MRRVGPAATLAIAVVAVASCFSAPDPVPPQFLTDGVWHGSIGPNDFIFEFRAAGDRLSGQAHMIQDGHQITVMEMAGVSLDGATIEMGFPAMAAYRGVIDQETGRITGGHPGAGAYEDLDLTRAEAGDWPMAAAKPMARDGEYAYTWTRPVDRDDGLQTATPEEVGIDPAAIERAVTAIVAGDAGAMHSLLIVRHGKLVAEEYFHGWQADDLHRLASCTKSVSSLLVGIAIDRGEIAGVDVALLDFFPEYRADAGEGWEALTLEHLLTMSMGLDWEDSELDAFPPPGQDRFADVIARNVSTEPGTQFRYVSRNTNLLSMVLLQATGVHADAFAAEHLFAPLGISSWDWENNKYQGHPGMSGTLKLRPRDMAKLGMLVLHEGRWNGQQVVSSDWIREATAARLHPSPDDEYGYLWWGFDDPPPGVDFATGMGSQYIVASPALDLVVVTTGGNDYNDKHSAILELIREHLGPGLR